MVLVSGPAPSVQFSWDGPGALAGGDDGKALCWDQASGRFTMVAKAAASHTHAPSDLSQGGATSGQVLAWNGSAWVATTPAAGVTDHGALTGLGDDDHAGYVLLAPAASTRNVIQPTGAAVVPLVVKGAASQSAALQTWQNSAGTALLQVTASGQLCYGLGGNGAFATFGSASLQLGTWGTTQVGVNWIASNTLGVVSMNATNTGLVVRGASGMSVNIIEAQVSTGTVVARVGPTGAGLFQPSTDVAPLVLKGHASATANLLELQNSAGAVKASVSPYGSISCLSISMSSTGGGLMFGSNGQWGSSADSTWELPWMDYAYSSTAWMRFASVASPTMGAAVWIQNPTSVGNHVLRLRGKNGQTGHLVLMEDSALSLQFAIAGNGRIYTNQAVANTNTPSGATVQAMPFYNAAGTLLGYAPLYAAPW